MPERYIAFDVETPNSANDRMSAIGVTVIEDGVLVDEFATLVNPETYFQPFHVQLTGITPEMAAQYPTFGELWPFLADKLDGGLLAAHNAPFDMGVLSKCLRAYGIPWKERADYICTCQMGRKCFPELPNHRLNTLCTYLDIPLDHHQAGSDSRACAELLLHYLDQGIDVNSFQRSYDLLCARTITRERSTRRRG